MNKNRAQSSPSPWARFVKSRCPERRYAFVCAAGQFALAGAFVIFSCFTELESLGLLFMVILTGLCLLMGLANVRAGFAAPKDSIVFVHPAQLSNCEQAKYYPELARICGLCFLTVIAISAYDLWQLEIGADVNKLLWSPIVEDWWPIVSLYQRYSYWPTLGGLLVIGLTCTSALLLKSRHVRLKPLVEADLVSTDSENSSQNPEKS